MLPRTVASRYSAALLALAVETGAVDAVGKDLARVEAEMSRLPLLAQAFSSPTIPNQVKKDFCRRLFAREVGPAVLNFLFLIIDKGREKLLNLMLEQYQDLVRRQQNIVPVKVVSAVSLDPGLRTTLESQLVQHLGRGITLDCRVDPNLLGGLVITMDDHIIDASVAGRLKKLRESLVHPA